MGVIEKTRKLIIVGDGAFAEIAYEYFTFDSEYKVAAFAVEQAYIKRESLLGLPVVPFETLGAFYPPADHSFYAALVYSQLNRLRTRLYRETKAKGYSAASYISSRAFVWRNVEIGEHCFIFEDNTVQPFVQMGNNVVLWSGNHIGHHSTIRNNCFISSHVVISGFCEIGESCFMGVNATVADNVKIGADSLIGAGALVTKSLGNNSFIKGQVGEASSRTAKQYFQIDI